MENDSDKIKRLKQGQRIALMAMVVALLVAGMKAIVGYLFDSTILIADALHSSADLLSNFAAFFGLWLASKPKTVRFPFGLYKAETLACLVIGGFIVLTGLEIFRTGYGKLSAPDGAQGFPLLPVVASAVSSLAALFVARKQLTVGVSIGSPALVANSREAFLDIFMSLIVMLGILLAYAAVPYVEGAIIMGIALLILKLGTKNIWLSLMVLMDANLDPKLQLEIQARVNQIYGIKGESRVKIRQSGPFRMVECSIATKPSLSIYKAHELADRVENFVTTAYTNIESVFIHMEPVKEKIVSAIFPVRDVNGLDSKIHGHFARAPYFVILKLKDDDVLIEDFYNNEFLGEKMHIGVKLARIIISHEIDLLFTSAIGEISYHLLKDNFVDIYEVKEGLSVKEIIEQYRLNRLRMLTGPTHAAEESLVAMDLQ